MTAAAPAPAVFPPDAIVPSVGIHFDVPFDVYRKWAAWNHSTLHKFRKTPQHVLHDLLTGDEHDTPEKDFGRLVHAAILEPERYDREIMVGPDVTTRRAKLWKTFEETAARDGRQLVRPKDNVAVLGAVRAAYTHETLGQILRGASRREVCIVWTDAETGLLCKVRIDLLGFLGEAEIVVDLKTAADAREHVFRNAAHDHGYFTQAAWIRAALRALRPGKADPKYLLGIVESDPPHCVAVYEVDEDAIAWGHERVMAYARTLRDCIASGRWPGYDAGVGLLGLPPWVFKTHGE